MENFEFIVSERVQENPDNPLAEYVNLLITHHQEVFFMSFNVVIRNKFKYM